MKSKNLKYVYLTIILCIFNLSYFTSKNYASENDKCNLAKANASQNTDEYLLGPGDLISVNVFSSSEISGDYQILNDGTVSLPIVGAINLKDLTLSSSSYSFFISLVGILYNSFSTLFVK